MLADVFGDISAVLVTATKGASSIEILQFAVFAVQVADFRCIDKACRIGSSLINFKGLFSARK